MQLAYSKVFHGTTTACIAMIGFFNHAKKTKYSNANANANANANHYQ